MEPLLAHHLLALDGKADIPPAVRTSLHSLFTTNAARSLTLAAELRAILHELRGAGIAALPYKGPAIAMTAYGNLALRRMRDLDLLVSPAEVDRACGLVAKRGYRQYTRLLRGPLRFRLEYQCGMVRDSDGTLVELHWMVAPPNIIAGPSFDDLWRRRVSHTFQGSPIPDLSPEDLVLTLCIHGSKHCWERLEWIAIIAAILRNGSPIDWPLVAARASEVGAARMVRLGLSLAHDVLVAPLPPALEAWTRTDAHARELAALTVEQLFREDDSSDARDDRRWFQWHLQDRLAGKLRFLWYWPLVRLGRRSAAWPRARTAGTR